MISFVVQVTARLIEHPLTLHAAVLPALSAYTGAPSMTAASISLPPTVHLHSFVRRDLWYPNETMETSSGVGNGGTYGVRFQQLPHAPGSVSFDFAGWLAGVALTNMTEVTIDLNTGLAEAQAKRLKWRSDGGSVGAAASTTKVSHSDASVQASASLVTFDAELIRSFVFTA